ncbi:MAG: ATP-binding cassette domain-containing protein [Clostridiales bacterium]|nr:ATP-binding cassette domain-containing protein [Clostridiales bacterium]
MIYLKKFRLPSPLQEELFLNDIRRTCYTGAYPFGIFMEREVPGFTFEPITIFCGGNGSGKSTILNVIAAALQIGHEAPFNRSAMFDDYVKLCDYEVSHHFAGECREKSRIIASDNVFDYLLNVRCLNDGIDNQREKLFEEYLDAKYSKFQFRGMGDYEDLRKVVQARRSTQSQYVRNRLMSNVRERSNGESALSCFVNTIEENALYLLDEPENSLSPEKQLELLSFLCDSARFYHCQIVLSTHSPFLLSAPGAKIYDLDSNPPRVRRFAELENVRVYYDFFKKHEDAFEAARDGPG